MEHDEDLPSPTGPDLSVRHARLPGDEPPIDGPTGQLPFVEGRRPTGHEPGAPPGVSIVIPPAIDRCAGHRETSEGHLGEGEALVSRCHRSTVAGWGCA